MILVIVTQKEHNNEINRTLRLFLSMITKQGSLKSTAVSRLSNGVHGMCAVLSQKEWKVKSIQVLQCMFTYVE